MKENSKVKNKVDKKPKPQKASSSKSQMKVKEKKSLTEAAKNDAKPVNKKMLIIIISIIAAAVVIAATIAIVCIIVNKNKPATVSAVEVYLAGKTSGYKAFETFDDDGLALRVYYSDQTEEIVEEGFAIRYVAQDESLHDDYFYAGENKVLIEYGGKSCYLSISPVAKLVQDYAISVSDYSQLETGANISLPSDFITITNLQGVPAQNSNIEIVYCTNFVSFEDYQPTNISTGAATLAGAPSKAGFYKVFAKLEGNQNYEDVYSNVAEFALIAEEDILLYARQGETHFGFKEIADASKPGVQTPNIFSPDYIEFSLEEVSGKKVLKYSSSFAESGEVMIFEDHVMLIGETKKTQILYKNNEILYKNSQNEQKVLTKWEVPSYLGTYQMTISSETAESVNMPSLAGQVCTLVIGYDQALKDGVVGFSLSIMRKETDVISNRENISGIVSYSIDQDEVNSLVFTAVSGSFVERLFSISNIELNTKLLQIEVLMSAEERLVSNGTYIRI